LSALSPACDARSASVQGATRGAVRAVPAGRDQRGETGITMNSSEEA
jgi:hypothetical protein